MKLRTISLFAILLLVVFGTAAQSISEDDLSFDFLKWHYQKYPNATNNDWTKITKGGTDYIYVNFEFDGTKRAVTYLESGHRVKERIKYDKEAIPTSTLTELEQRFEKFKIEEFQQLNLYAGVKLQDSFYTMNVKVKKDTYILYFDENLGEIESPSPQLMSSL